MDNTVAGVKKAIPNKGHASTTLPSVPRFGGSHSRGIRAMTFECAVLLVLALAFLGSVSATAEAGDEPAQSIDSPAETSAEQQAEIPASLPAPPDFNRTIFRKNKVEFSLESGFQPFNTPLVLDPILGFAFKRDKSVPNYEMVPVAMILRWQLYGPRGPWLLRGNTEFDFGAEYVGIPRGPESMYTGPLIGVRYNFVQPNTSLVPFLEMRGGLGYTDAAGPWEVKHHLGDVGQGQKFTFTFSLGSGIRYDFNDRYSASLAVSFRHISNLYMSEPKYYNHGINVVGGLMGFNVMLNGLFPFLPE